MSAQVDYLLSEVKSRIMNLQTKSTLFETRHGKARSGLDSLGLTRREQEVLLPIATGKTNTEISILLHISKRTVDDHTANIFKKLGVKSRTAAAFRLYEIYF